MPPEDPASAAPARWLGAHEAAGFLGIHRSTLHAAVRQGAIVPDAHTPGGHMRFREQTLIAFRDRLAEGSATAGTLFASVGALGDLARLLGECAPFERVCNAAIAGIQTALPGVDICAIAVRADDPLDPAGLRCVVSAGVPDWAFADYVRLHRTFKFATAVTLRSGEMELCEDTASESMHTGTARICRALRLGAYAILPIGAGRQTFGVLNCSCHRPHLFSDHERAFLRGVADHLAAAYVTGAHLDALRLHVAVTSELTAAALGMRARREREAEIPCDTAPAGDDPRTELGDIFRRLTGAARICAVGFGVDLLDDDRHLQELACAARDSKEPARRQWREGGILYTGVAVGVPTGMGSRAAAAAAWSGERQSLHGDSALLASFVAAYTLAVGLQ